MIKAETKLKAWGNSVGVILPKEALREGHLSVNDEVEVVVRKRSHPLREAFGMLKEVRGKSGKSTEMLLREVDRELESRFD